MRTVAAIVARNVAELRDQRRLSVRALSERLTDVGHPILASGISKIENGERKVSVEDLLALAVTLDVSPVRLLLPGRDDGDPIALTSTRSAVWQAAWRWAVGEQPLEYLPLSDRRVSASIEESRPFENEMWMEEVVRGTAAREPAPWHLSARSDGTWSFGYDSGPEDEDDDDAR